MYSFSFVNPVKILFGEGKIAELSAEIPQGSKILMTYGFGSIKQNGVYQQVKQALQAFTVIEFGGIEANPQFTTLMKAVDVVKTEGIDFILAVGGGSVIDGSKFIASAVYYEGEDAYNICKRREVTSQAVALGAVLTLAATGSEMNSGGVISRKETKEKFAFDNALLFPKFSVLDPSTLFSLPKRQIGNGIIDTFVHVMEQYITYPVNAPIQDGFAETILRTLIALQPKIYMSDAKDLDNYANFMWAATWGLNGYIGLGVEHDWATHMIGHELTALKGLDHGVTLAIVMPKLLRHLKTVRAAKLLQYATNVWGITAGTDAQKIDSAIAKTEEFFKNTGVAPELSAHNISNADVQEIQERFKHRKIEKIGVASDVLVSELTEWMK